MYYVLVINCLLVKTSCGQIVPLVVSLAAYDLIVPLVVTHTVLFVTSCSVVYKASDVLAFFYTQHHYL